MRYFIMVNHPNGYPQPIMHDESNVELFDSEDDAETWAGDSDFANAYGYTVYPWDF
jgi:hypothetical protein